VLQKPELFQIPTLGLLATL